MDFLAHLVGAAMLVNGVPHLVHGLSGDEFPTPFAKPPGIGLSRPEVNVLWAAFNLAAGGALLAVGEWRPGANPESAAVCGMALLVGVALARSAARSRARREERARGSASEPAGPELR